MTGEMLNQEPAKLKGMCRTSNTGPGGAMGCKESSQTERMMNIDYSGSLMNGDAPSGEG
jgi:hypothetical protein